MRGPAGSTPPTSAPSNPEAEAPSPWGQGTGTTGPYSNQGRGASVRPGLAKFLRAGDDLAHEGVSHGMAGT